MGSTDAGLPGGCPCAGGGNVSEIRVMPLPKVTGIWEHDCSRYPDTIRIPMSDGKVITFVNTHLEVKTAKMRIEQVKFIEKYLKGRKNQLFLAGDMNATPDTKEMAMLRENWADLTNTVFTYHTSKPEIKIDYIYTRPSENVELVNTAVKEDVKLSDHFPVISTIVLH
jgi:endonuclease/exonuclease/phosphatase family metal-dependent hydrolase